MKSVNHLNLINQNNNKEDYGVVANVQSSDSLIYIFYVDIDIHYTHILKYLSICDNNN